MKGFLSRFGRSVNGHFMPLLLVAVLTLSRGQAVLLTNVQPEHAVVERMIIKHGPRLGYVRRYTRNIVE